MERRTRGKRLALGLLPAAATTAVLVAGVGPAGANTTSTTHTYTDGNDVQHTCTINMTRTVPFNGDDQVGEGATSVTGGSACTDGPNAFISAFWNDPDGEGVSTIENSDGQSTIRRYAPIGSGFTTVHRVDFGNSSLGCNADCEFSVNRSK